MDEQFQCGRVEGHPSCGRLLVYQGHQAAFPAGLGNVRLVQLRRGGMLEQEFIEGAALVEFGSGNNQDDVRTQPGFQQLPQGIQGRFRGRGLAGDRIPQEVAILHPDHLAAWEKRQCAQGLHDLADNLGRFIGISAARFQDFMGKLIRSFRQGGKNAGSLFTHHPFIRAENEMNGLLFWNETAHKACPFIPQNPVF